MCTPDRPRRVLAAAALGFVLAAGLATSQTPPRRYGLGRRPTPDQIRAWDIDVGPDGTGLPPGSGTAAEGRPVYAARCAECHGATGTEGPQDVLAGGQGTLATGRPLKTVGSFWPYAPTLWDYINRAMPFDRPGTLTPDQVYAVVAYVLQLNGLVSEEQRLDARTLPAVEMPNRRGFVPDPRPDVPAPRPSRTSRNR